MGEIHISFVIINWNSAHFLESCIPSLINQNGLNVEIILIDNNSTDNTKEIIKDLPKQVKIVLNNKNTGYSGAANQGINMSRGMYVSIINPDVILDENYSLNIINELESNPLLGGATGKLIKYDFNEMQSLSVIDTTGIEAHRNLNTYDRGQNSKELNKFDSKKNVFGISGAAPIYRKKTLNDVRIENEYFDEDFLAYKEDIDLSWRIRSYGWELVFVPEAIAHHGRAISGTGNNKIKDIIDNRKKQSDFIKLISLRNHYCMLVKNLDKSHIRKHGLLILTREFKRLIYYLLLEYKSLKGLVEAFRLLPKMLHKRRIINATKNERTSTVYFVK
ncbi:glycosyltransferase family 2 protein [Guptibacillus algicola]|uniref:glycosyltransferase family 2 protein n=1 Tax=Guptibacillus algicola TaxID=225844 RepID=UPI001CD6F859|nr:glycosyltransferase family 2 protein [Alkalihalobacillus algicola]MCA0987056.1 glycosyltransferase family 2 protein [Alkalihalobacillus algicola]